jgi:hypothetical protein
MVRQINLFSSTHNILHSTSDENEEVSNIEESIEITKNEKEKKIEERKKSVNPNIDLS